MKVVYLIPGSGAGFYCENCMRDIPLLTALKKLDAEVIKIPVYLPLFTDEKSYIDDHGVFLGAVNLYLKYKFPSLKTMPGWISKILNSRPVLKLAARFSSSTQASGLEGLTMDMLSGKMPYLNKETEQLTDFLADHVRPDIIHLSNALLAGLGLNLKRSLAERNITTRLVCTLQDEHTWLDNMNEEYRAQAWETLRRASEQIDMFFPVSRYYNKFMSVKLGLKKDRTRVVNNGINCETYADVNPSAEPPVIGYLSRLHKGFGLDKLAEIFLKLKKEPGLENLQLRITGGHTGEDHKFIRKIRRRLRSNIRKGDVRFFRQFNLKHRLDFFNGMTVLSVPMEQPEAFGIYLLEAMASGITAVQPDIGSFPEIIDSSSGIIYDAEKKDSLYNSLRKVLLEPENIQSRTVNARNHAHNNYCLDSIAEKLKKHYQDLAGPGKIIREEKCS